MTIPEIPLDTSPKGVAVARQILDLVVQYPDFERIQNASVASTNLMLQLKMSTGILVLAEPGMGKTLLLELIQRNLTRKDNVLEKASPVLTVSLDSAVDTHKIAAKAMMALGYPMLPSRPNLESMTLMVDRAIERLGPKVLLIDESQHMCEGNRDITARAVTDWLKVRMDKHNLPVVCAGTPTFERICDINEQFVSRASTKYVLNPFAFGDGWVQLMQAVKVGISLIEAGLLETPWCLKMLHAVTHGNLRRLKKLLIYASIECADRENPILTRDDLRRGFDRAFGFKEGPENPFYVRG
ncbi:MAG: hypothetical protein A3J24_09890 [Deltaproteobacteria bacterium RIFCSPLOWO2_02_FULL_53_8]|nr:MAG: hypothetical protein A3J24_09890 [Deltaproteobacteria bacterium RIFCSPLOWO2_02_FULL_53_8]